jgi:tRNA (mo5U34)-methyltransferase
MENLATAGKKIHPMNRAEKEEIIKTCDWYHSIEIEEGLITPGRIPHKVSKGKLDGLQLPEDLKGLSVLDIGANDGFFSFEAERRGAERVVALELWPELHCMPKAIQLLDSKVELVKGSVYDVSPDVHGTFDIVLFLGVLYHLRHPLLALDRLFRVTRKYMLLETQYLDKNFIASDGASIPLEELDPRLNDVSLYQFYPKDEMRKGDPTNWFAPNVKAIETSLRSAGFEPEYLHDNNTRITFRATKIPDFKLPPVVRAETI